MIAVGEKGGHPKKLILSSKLKNYAPVFLLFSVILSYFPPIFSGEKIPFSYFSGRPMCWAPCFYCHQFPPYGAVMSLVFSYKSQITREGNISKHIRVLFNEVLLKLYEWHGESAELHYIPASTKLKGGYIGFTLSVCPSMDRMMSALSLQQYSLDPFHICTSYQATSENVLRVMFVSTFNNLRFWQIL